MECKGWSVRKKLLGVLMAAVLAITCNGPIVAWAAEADAGNHASEQPSVQLYSFGSDSEDATEQPAVPSTGAGTVYVSGGKSIDKAQSLSLNTTVVDSIGLDGDDDWFKVILPKAGPLTIGFSSPYFDGKSSAYWRILLVDEDGNVYTWWDYYCGTTKAAGARDFASVGLPAGTYYIQVSGYDVVDQRYNITPKYQASAYWETEGNDDITQADPIQLGKTYSGTITPRSAGGEYDWFKVTLPKAGPLTIGFSSPYFDGRGKTEWIIYLTDKDGNVYTWWDYYCGTTKAAGARDFASVGLPAGTYYIQVWGSEDAIDQRYNITPKYQASAYWETERNDDITQADPIQLGKTYSGTITPRSAGGEYDWFKVTLPKAGPLTIGFSSPYFDGSGKTEWMIYLTDKDGKDVASWYYYCGTTKAAGVKNFVNASLPSGTYYIQVWGSEDAIDQRYSITPKPSIAKATVSALSDKAYTGSAIKPVPTVTYGSTTLKSGTDYTLSYKNNVNVGTATITIKGKGGYTGTKDVTFNINPAKLTKDNITVANQAYTTKAVTPNPTVKIGSTTLKKGTDYTVSYKNNIKVGTGTVTVKGKGNCTGSASKTFKITKANVAKLDVAKVPDQLYTGKVIKPGVAIKNNGTTLKSGTDYTLAYANNTKIGTATITITGKGNYTGTKKVTFKIAKTLPLSMAKVTGVSNKVYTGKAVTQKPTVKVNGTTLKQGSDYTVKYTNNTKVGTATITLTGKGKYTGTKKVTFKIAKANLAKATVSGVANKTYTGKAITQKPTVKLNGATLKQGSDYTVAYKNNTKVGTATLTVKGKGNYAGSVSKTFKITQKAAAKWSRLWGKSQFDTMQQIVNNGWKGKTGGTVVVATSSGYWDALSAAGVAGLSGAPVLITNGSALSPQTRAALVQLKPRRVIIAGGEKAVRPAVANAIKSATGVNPTRVFGRTATDTAAELAKRFFPKGTASGNTAILATSKGFYDALSAAPISYAKHYPIFLVENKNTISKNTLSAMKACGITNVIIAGGTSVVNTPVVTTLKNNGISVNTRLGGQTLYDTSRLIANWGISHGMSADKVGVATSYSYYDALCGAAMCGKNNAVLVLADAKNSSNTAFTKANKAKIFNGYVFGGEKAVAKSVFNSFDKSTK